MKLDPKKNFARFHHYDPIYRFNWYYYSGVDAQLCMDHVLQVLSIAYPWEVRRPDALGSCYKFEKIRAGYIWTKEHTPDPRTIVHETFHAMTLLSERMDSKIDEDNEEFFSYYQDFLFGEIMQTIKKKEVLLWLKGKKK